MKAHKASGEKRFSEDSFTCYSTCADCGKEIASIWLDEEDDRVAGWSRWGVANTVTPAEPTTLLGVKVISTTVYNTNCTPA